MREEDRALRKQLGVTKSQLRTIVRDVLADVFDDITPAAAPRRPPLTNKGAQT